MAGLCVEDVAGPVSEACGVELAELCGSPRHGNETRSAAIYLAHRVTDEAVGAIGTNFRSVSMAAICRTVARAENRRQDDRARDRRLAELCQ